MHIVEELDLLPLSSMTIQLTTVTSTKLLTYHLPYTLLHFAYDKPRMSGESSSVKRYDADFKKIPGTLSITAAAIAWVPKTPGAMDRQSQALNRAMGMLSCRMHRFQLTA
jgi:hypothetical protein